MNTGHRGKSPSALQVLRRRNFRNLWLANSFADVGSHIRAFGIAWVALELSDSQLWVGLALGATALPIIVLSLLSGALVDRISKRQIIMFSQVILAGLLFLIVFLAVTDRLQVWHLPIITLGVGAVFAFLQPAREVFVIESIKKDQILTANSLGALSNNAGEMLAPALAGIAIARYGAESPFVLAGIVYVVATALILRTRSSVTLADPGTRHSLLNEIREGVTYAVSNKRILALLVIAATAVFGTAIIPLLPVYGRDVLDAGPSGYGVLAASLAGGYLTGSLLMTALGDLPRKGLWLLVTAAVWDAGAVAFGFSRVFSLSVVILVIMGISGSMFITLLKSLIQQLTACEMRGRVLSLYHIAFSAMPIGFIVGGALAQTVSNEFALIFGAAMGSPIIVALFLRIPSLRSL